MSRGDVRGWARLLLGADVGSVLFTCEHLSAVYGIRLSDDRAVVMKARHPQQRVAACVEVQSTLWELGFPCPRPLAGPVVVDGVMVTVEELVPGGEMLPRDGQAARLFAELLARLVELAPLPPQIGSLDPVPPWLGWDHGGAGLWPVPDDIDVDLNAIEGPAWIDDAARAASDVLATCVEGVVGHGDWESQNIRWHDATALVVHDWDSVAIRPESALAGVASAVWPASGETGAASVEESQAFIDAYRTARGQTWDADDLSRAWAAGLWIRAFNAKKRIARGLAPDPDLTEDEANERLTRAGA